MTSSWSFDQRATTYDRLQWVNDVNLLQAMTELLDRSVQHRVGALLDVATGTGAVAQELVRPGARVVGVDLSWLMLKQAVHKTSAVHYVQARGEKLPISSGVIDLVVSRNGLHQMAEPGVALREMRRVLATSGYLCVIESVAPPEPVKKHWREIILLKDRGRHRDFTFTAQELEAWIERHGFKIIDTLSHEIRFDVDEWITMGGVTGDRARNVRKLFELADTEVVEAMKIRNDGASLTATKTSHIALATLGD